MTCACASLARADYNPVALTPGSYTFDIVVPANYVQAVPYCINVTAGAGVSLNDNTYYEQGLYARPGQVGGNSGIPAHNTVFTDINNSNIQFLMPPDYTTNNEVMVDTTGFSTGDLMFNTPTTATNLAILCCGGGGSLTVSYTVSHSDGTTDTGTLNLPDWFTGGSAVAWGANGREDKNGNINNFNSSAVNNNAPYLYALNIAVSGASPITNINLSAASGNHGNFFAVSGNASGAAWTPIPLNQNSFNCMGIIPASLPFPVTATMDQGTNLNHNGNLATWFESGYVRGVPGSGLPLSGTIFQSLSQPTHFYQMGDYSTNNATLIDTNHQVANITPASPAPYYSFALLTAGGNVGGNPMTNICVLQHADGVNETNLFYGYDWFDNNHPGAIAYKAGGRVNFSGRSVNQIGNNYPYLFESYFLLNDTTSPVTNILVMYKTAGNPNSTTYIMAVSASTTPVPPIVDVGPVPSPQTLFPGQTATFTVGTVGSEPITGYWQVENNGTYFNLADGVDANGSTISGSQTTTLTISNLFLPDGTNYQYVASNAAGTGTSPAGVLIVSPQLITITPANPIFYTSNNIPLTVNLSAGPAVGLQWFYIDTSGFGVTNLIAGATNATYTIVGAPFALNGYTYGVIATNIYGTNTASVVLNISDSPAFLVGDLSPSNAEAYVGAPVTYSVNAQGNSPMYYQWIVNGAVVSGATNSSYTFPVGCGTTTIQAAFSNELSGGVSIATSQVNLQGDANPTNLTFNVNGAGWQSNNNGNTNIGVISNNVLLLTDNNGGEASSAFFKTAQYVGGAWTASFTYNSHGGAADGAAFIFQTTNATALGGSGGELGYGGGAMPNSVAFQINLYNGNNETPGIALAINGNTGIYQSALPVDTTSTNDIHVSLNWANGVLAVSLTDAGTGANYSTNYTVGSLVPFLGANVAYVGFSGGDGGATSTQTISNFQFHSVLPPVALSASPVTGNTFVISWSAADPTYVLQTTTSLSSPSWVAGPVPVTSGGVSHVTVDVTSGSEQFYRLVRVPCQ